MLGPVARMLEDAEKDEACRHRGVENSQKNDGGYHEGKGDLLVDRPERPKSGRRHVLVARVSVNDAADDAKDNDLGNCTSPEGFGKVPVRG